MLDINDNIWYENRPLGIQKLGTMMKEMSEAAGLSEKYTNHSVRATLSQSAQSFYKMPHSPTCFRVAQLAACKWSSNHTVKWMRTDQSTMPDSRVLALVYASAKSFLVIL